MQTICRVHYCANCDRRRSPHYGDYFLAFGTTRNDYVTYRSMITADRFQVGFTPHLIIKLSEVENVVTYKYACSLQNCGCIEKVLPNNTRWLYVPNENWKIGFMSTKDWEAMILFTDSGYEI